MAVRRVILALGLLVLTGRMVGAGLLPESSGQTVIFALVAIGALVATATLFARRRIGALLALGAGLGGMGVAISIGVGRGFSGQPVDPVISIAGYAGIGVAILALFDVVASLVARRSA